MDPNDLNTAQLREVLEKVNFSASGSKGVIFNNMAQGEEKTGSEIVEPRKQTSSVNIARGEPSINNADLDSNTVGQSSTSKDLNRELDLIRRERDLLRREIELIQRENDILRRSLCPMADVNGRQHISLQLIGHLLCEFDGTNCMLEAWERRVRSVQNTYELDDNKVKILIESKLRGKALSWLQSKAKHAELSSEELLKEMRKMFNDRLIKLSLKKQFEDRKWAVSESYREYHLDKLILANRVSIDEADLVEYLIEGIPEPRMRDLAHMQCFRSAREMFEAFERISLCSSTPLKSRQKSRRGFSGPSKPASSGAKPQGSDRCFNCNEVGHFSPACPKPKRACGSCFTCGTMGHTYRNCPKATNSEAAQREETALVERPEPTTTSATSIQLTESSRRCVQNEFIADNYRGIL